MQSMEEIWLQELRVLINRVEQNVIERMLLAKEQLPAPGDLTIIQNLQSNLSLITSHTEQMASKDLAYNILHHVNSLTNNLISPTIPCPALAPAPGLAVLMLPPQIEFTSSHSRDKPSDVSHPESYDALLKPLVPPVGINWDANLSTLSWSTGTYHNTPFTYAKDSPDHEPQLIGINFAGHLCIALSKHILGQLLHHEDHLPNHEEHDS